MSSNKNVKIEKNKYKNNIYKNINRKSEITFQYVFK